MFQKFRDENIAPDVRDWAGQKQPWHRHRRHCLRRLCSVHAEEFDFEKYQRIARFYARVRI